MTTETTGGGGGAPPPATTEPGGAPPPPPPATNGASGATTRPDWLPPTETRFWDDKEGVKAADLYKSYSEIQGLVGRRVTDLNEAQRRALYEAIPDEVKQQYGKELREGLKADKDFLQPLREAWEAELPKAPERYELPQVEGFEFEADNPLHEELVKFAAEKRLSQEDYAKLIQLGTELVKPLLPGPLEERMRAVGGDYVERAKAIVNRTRTLAAQAAGSSLLNRERATADNEALLAAVSSPEAFRALERLLMAGEERPLPGSHHEPPEEVTHEKLQAMQRDPKYWRDHDPAFVRQVTDGFEKLYGKGARL